MAEKIIGFRITIKGDEETVKKLAQVELELAAVNKKLAEAKKLGNDDVYKELRVQQEKLKNSAKELKKEVAESQKQFEQTKFAEGSYRALDAQLGKLRRSFKELSKAEREGSVGRALLGDISKLDTQLKNIDAGIGQFQRNVGNYAGGLRGLFGSLKQTIVASGLIGRGGIGAFAGQLQNGLEKVQQVAKQLNETFNSTSLINQKVADSTDDAAKSFVEERIKLDTLTVTAFDANKPIDQRKKAIATLQADYPAYFGSLDLETAKQEDVEAAYKGANQQIIAGIKQRLIAKVLEEQLTESITKELEAEKARNDERLAGLQAGNLALQFSASINTQLAEQSAATSKRAAGDTKTIEGAVDKTLNAIKNVVGDYAAAFGDVNDLTKKTTDAAKVEAEKQDKIREEQAKKAESAAKLLIEIQIRIEKQRQQAVADSQKELERQRIEGLKVESEKLKAEEQRRLKDFEGAQQERLKTFDESAKQETDKLVETFGKGSQEVLQQQEALGKDRAALEADVQKIIQNEVVLSNEKIAALNKDFAEKQARARVEIQAQALKDALEKQEAALGGTQKSLQAVQLKFDFDQQQSQAAFEAARAELELQLAQGLISQEAFSQQLTQLEIAQLESAEKIAQERLAVERALQAEILAQQQQQNELRLAAQLQDIENEKQARLAALQAQFDQELISQEQFEQARAQAIESAAQRTTDARAATLQENAILEQQYSQQVIQESQQRAAAQIAIEREKTEAIKAEQKAQIQEIQKTLQAVSDSFGQIADIIQKTADAADERAIKSVNKKYDNEAKLAFGNAQKLKEIDDKRQGELEQINKRILARQKAIAISQAIINGALAVTNILANMIDPTPVQAFKAIAIGLAVATTAAQIATIAAQKFARGGVLFAGGGELSEGVLEGPSHAQGGVKVVTPSGMAELEGGEWVGDDELGATVVVNKRSTAKHRRTLNSITGRNFAGKRALLSAINSDGGYGVKFERGGLMSAPLAVPNLSTSTNSNELQQRNRLLESNNALLQANLSELQRIVLTMQVVADAGELMTEGQKQQVRVKKQTLG